MKESRRSTYSMVSVPIHKWSEIVLFRFPKMEAGARQGEFRAALISSASVPPGVAKDHIIYILRSWYHDHKANVQVSSQLAKNRSPYYELCIDGARAHDEHETPITDPYPEIHKNREKLQIQNETKTLMI